MTSARGRWAAALLLGASLPGTVAAMTGLLLLEPPPQDHTRWAWGGAVWHLHTLPTDAPQRRTLGYPAFDVQRPDGLFASSEVGFGWNASTDRETQYGVRLSPWPGRRHAGVPVGTRLEEGVFFNRAMGQAWLWQFSTRHGGGRRRDGWVTEAGFTSGVPLGTGEPLGITLGGSWANGAYRSSYDGAGSPWRSGLQDVQLALSYEHRIDVHWRIDGQWLSARSPMGARAAAMAPEGRDRAYQRLFSIGLWHDWR